MNIDKHTGAITLPNGLTIEPRISLDELRERGQQLTPPAHPASGQTFRAGEVDGKPLLVQLVLHKGELDHISMSVDLYPPGPRDWSQWSLEMESQIKLFHDALLRRLLGEPTRITPLPGYKLHDPPRTIDMPEAWDFPWGTITSAHDFKGSGTYIIVRYVRP